MGPPAMVASGEKTTMDCIEKHIRCAIVGKSRRKKPEQIKWCRPFGPDIVDDPWRWEHVDINRDWKKDGGCDRRRRRRRR